MHVETYPAFFTPRDKEPTSHPLRKNPQSLIGQKEKEQENKNIYEKQSKCSVDIFLTYTKGSRPKVVVLLFSLKNRLPRAIYKENYKTKYLKLFTPFPNLITKESYNWWVTRRKWGFRHQKSEAKYPKVLVANIGKLQEKFRCTVQNGCEIISQQKGDFAAVQKSSFSLE